MLKFGSQENVFKKGRLKNAAYSVQTYTMPTYLFPLAFAIC